MLSHFVPAYPVVRWSKMGTMGIEHNEHKYRRARDNPKLLPLIYKYTNYDPRVLG